MGKVSEASIKLVNDGLKFECTAGGQPPVYTDHPTPPAAAEGYAPTQLLLISLATCSGGVVTSLLRKFRKDVADFSVNIHGTRREEDPHSFTHIVLEFTVTSGDVTEADMARALTMAEEKYCSVWAMLKGNVEITSTVTIKRP